MADSSSAPGCARRLGALWLVMLGACGDGYPTEDAPMADPSSMDRTQLLSALNDLGSGPYQRDRWRYALDAECTLEIRVPGTDPARLLVDLRGASISSRGEDGTTEVQVIEEGETDEVPTTVIATNHWADSLLAKSLFTHLVQRCDDPSASRSSELK